MGTNEQGSNFINNPGSVDGAANKETGSGDNSTSWRDALSEEYRNNDAFQQYKSIDDLAKTYLHLNQKIGQKGHIPDANADADAWNNFYKAAGRPDDINGYSVEKDALGPGTETVLTIAHRSGLSDRQTQDLVNGLSSVNAENQAKAKELHDSLVDKMVEYYGDADKVAEVTKQVNENMGRVFGEDSAVYDYLENTKVIGPTGEEVSLSQDPRMVEVMRKMFEKTGNDNKEIKGDGNIGQTEEELTKRFQQLTADMAVMPEMEKHGSAYAEKLAELNKVRDQIVLVREQAKK